MDVLAYNRRAWDRQVEQGNRWTVPVTPETIAAARRGDWHILLTPAYLLIMAFGVRPVMRRLNGRFLAIGRLTPDLLSVVVVLLILSSFSTECCHSPVSGSSRCAMLREVVPQTSLISPTRLRAMSKQCEPRSFRAP